MKRRRKSRSLVAFAVFVVLIFVGGYALNVAGYDDNPFDEITFLSNWTSGGEQRFEQEFVPDTAATDFSPPPGADTGIDLTGLSETNSQFQLPSLGDSGSSISDATVSFQSGDMAAVGSDDQNVIAWSDVGDVLYDFWFICATTAIFIVVQQCFKFSIKQVKRRLPTAAAAQ